MMPETMIASQMVIRKARTLPMEIVTDPTSKPADSPEDNASTSVSATPRSEETSRIQAARATSRSRNSPRRSAVVVCTWIAFRFAASFVLRIARQAPSRTR